MNSVHSFMLCAGILVVLYGFTVEFARFADCVPPFKLTASLKVVNLGLTSSWLAIADLLLAGRFDLLRIRVCGGKRQVTGHISTLSAHLWSLLAGRRGTWHFLCFYIPTVTSGHKLASKEFLGHPDSSPAPPYRNARLLAEVFQLF